MRSLLSRPLYQNEAGDGDGTPAEVVPQPKAAPVKPQKPEGFYVDEADWNRTQAELRKLRTAQKSASDADEARKRTEEQDAAKAAGDFDKALGKEREAREAAESRLKKRDVRDAVVAEASARGMSAEQARALAKLTSLSDIEIDDLGEARAEQVAAAVDATVNGFPNMFSADAPKGEPAKRRRQSGPASPAEEGAPFEGFLTPEEYARTPHSVRMTPEFQARANKSAHYWPDTVNAVDLG